MALLVSLGIILYDKLTTSTPKLFMDDPFKEVDYEGVIGKSGLVEDRKAFYNYFIKITNIGSKIATHCKVRLAIFNSKKSRLLPSSPLSTRGNDYEFSINAQTSEELLLCSHHPDHSAHPPNSLYFYPFAYSTIHPKPFNDQTYYIRLEASADEIQRPFVKYYKIENSKPLKFISIKPDLLS